MCSTLAPRIHLHLLSSISTKDQYHRKPLVTYLDISTSHYNHISSTAKKNNCLHPTPPPTPPSTPPYTTTTFKSSARNASPCTILLSPWTIKSCHKTPRTTAARTTSIITTTMSGAMIFTYVWAWDASGALRCDEYQPRCGGYPHCG
ncbi:hypothetical protein P171DRAFT_214280 [Karstenula rhodostoma CBS 690.94]|uniref:Uncharacterized protein n=1 Tax=Karstenula rhodostoma CBS 690.94 TaxID=1392251 RepID=A0A9P4PNS5_9PLEO|nr:hypothetical protein P171DRAFT_214280 [Karstenula rhodostoma CBS 690.94]